MAAFSRFIRGGFCRHLLLNKCLDALRKGFIIFILCGNCSKLSSSAGWKFRVCNAIIENRQFPKRSKQIPTESKKLTGLIVWVLTDGKIGDRVQCLGIVDCLGLEAEEKTILPGKPWEWLLPWGPIPPRHRPDRRDSPIAPPFPDLVIASGRRLVPYLRILKQASADHTFTVFLKDPRLRSSCADLIWVPWHDKLRGPNVFVTHTAPHGIRPDDLAAARQRRPETWGRLPRPYLGLVIGDPLSRARSWQDAVEHFLGQIDQMKGQVGSFLVTPSRRTPRKLMRALSERLWDVPHWIWSGDGENPYVSILAHSDMLAVTADSHNMVGEALSTGKPVFPIKPLRLGPKLDRFLGQLKEHGVAKPFEGLLEPYDYEPVDATVEIAAAISVGLEKHRQGLTLG